MPWRVIVSNPVFCCCRSAAFANELCSLHANRMAALIYSLWNAFIRWVGCVCLGFRYNKWRHNDLSSSFAGLLIMGIRGARMEVPEWGSGQQRKMDLDSPGDPSASVQSIVLPRADTSVDLSLLQFLGIECGKLCKDEWRVTEVY